MKTVVLVVQLQISDQQSKHPIDIADMFQDQLVKWAAYEPFENNAPIRINIDSDGFEEI